MPRLDCPSVSAETLKPRSPKPPKRENCEAVPALCECASRNPLHPKPLNARGAYAPELAGSTCGMRGLGLAEEETLGSS